MGVDRLGSSNSSSMRGSGVNRHDARVILKIGIPDQFDLDFDATTTITTL